MSILRRKITLIGDFATGKTSMVRRFLSNKFTEFTESTIGAAYNLYKTETIVDGVKHNLYMEIWDTAGQERYESLTPMYYRGATIILIVYDTQSYECFNSVKKWLSKINTEHSEIMIIGNKIDIGYHKNNDNLLSFLQSFNYEHYYISCKTGENVDILFKRIIEKASNINISVSNNIISNYQNENDIEKNCSCL